MIVEKYRKSIIENGIKKGQDLRSISRKIFFIHKNFSLIDKEETEFGIKNEVAKYFKIHLNSIKTSGSSHIGYSIIKEKDFSEKTSDLDLAIISPKLYFEFWEFAYSATNGFKNLTYLPPEPEAEIKFKEYIMKGVINPKIFPIVSKDPSQYNGYNDYINTNSLRIFFNRLSNNYSKNYKEINCFIYASEFFFESKQKELLEILKRKENL